MKLTKKQLDIIIENTPEELKGKTLAEVGALDGIGTHYKVGANWYYTTHYVPFNGVNVLVVRGSMGAIL